MPASAHSVKQLQFHPEQFPSFLQNECGLLLVDRFEVEPEREEGRIPEAEGKQGGVGQQAKKKDGAPGSGFNRPIFVFQKLAAVNAL